MAENTKRLLERFQYWQHQMLRADDFRAQHATDEQLRWWHNRSLHRAYGVRSGLTVNALASASELTLEVACGIAYDCFGRELFLSAAAQVRAPEGKKDSDFPLLLLVRHGQTTGAASCCEGRVDPCWPARPARPPGTVELVWKPEAMARVADGVPLARLKGTASAPSLDSFRPPAARPLARPRLVSGDTIPGNTPWEVWNEDLRVNGRVRQVAMGVQTRIDTSAAGFTHVPCYFAQLAGPLWNPTSGVFIPAFFANLAEATTTGFTFRLLMRGIPKAQLELDLQSPRSQPPTPTISAAKHRGIALPQRVQRLAQISEEANLRPGDQIFVTEKEVSSSEDATPILARVSGLDLKEKLVTLDFGVTDSPPQLAERVAAFAIFNPDFNSLFAAFARKQMLHVSWVGCEGMMAAPQACPGVMVIPPPCSQREN